METLVLLFFVIVMFAIFGGKKKAKYTPPHSSMPDPAIFRHFEAKSSLLVNTSEIAFFHALVRAVPSHFYVLAKPRLEDVIGVRKNLGDAKLSFQLRGRVKSRHIDFLVIDWSGKPLCGIELDGKSHKSQKAQAGDTLKNGIFEASGVPLHRVIVGQDFAIAAQNIVSQIPSPRQT